MVLEFTFCLIVVLLMLYAVARVFTWAGKDLIKRREIHDAQLISGGAIEQQISPFFYMPVELDAVWNGK